MCLVFNNLNLAGALSSAISVCISLIAVEQVEHAYFADFFNNNFGGFSRPIPPPPPVYTVRCSCNFACFFTEVYSLKHSLI